MPEDTTSQAGSKPIREPFITIDDLQQKAKELAWGLKQLSDYKHPLDIRRGVGKRRAVRAMRAEGDSRQVKAGGGKTYFLDIEQTQEGSPYLKITESRFKGEGKQRERSSLIVFSESADVFLEAVTEMIAKLKH
jgi:hypothetical protein